jgi:cytochrome c biogenesis protein CcdA
VLPLVPGYLSYVSGVSGQDVQQGRGRSGRVLVTGLWDGLLSQLRVWAGSVNLPL